ncbi:MAG: penicillin-binding protein 2 [Desulfococcaceae bacterium]|nr:penicillin-binding protein 2 [Desulfococcaceae bacterium]
MKKKWNHKKRDMQKKEEKGISFRISLIAVFFAFCFLLIAAKLIWLQVYRSPWLSEKAANQYEKTLTVQGKRGIIYDRNRREMAVSIDVVSAAAYPPRIKDTASVSETLGTVLGLDPRALRLRLISRRSFIWIKRQVTPDEEKAVRNLKLDGIDFIPEHSRFYPNRFIAAQVLGFTGLDGHGLEGIEFYYDSYLKGGEVRYTVRKDALGKKLDAGQEKHAENSGNDIILTIDRNIQYITEKVLKETVDEFSAKSGMALVMEPSSGAVLAMANVPLFNPNSFSRFNKFSWRNRCITDPFEPGSTMKIFSAAAAIESGGCTSNTIFYCENGKYRIGKDDVHDTHAYGWLTLEKIIKYSSNIGAIKMGEMIGPEMLYRVLKNFGFGDKSGLDCPGETAGMLAPYERWTKIDAGTIAYGHGISVSVLQLAAAVSAIANKGLLMKPYIVSAVCERNGEKIREFAPAAIRQAVSPQTAETVSKMMVGVTEEGGTGVRAALEGYTVCGKTGTSVKVDKKGEYTRDAYVASFAGFAPRENPRVTVVVVLDEPRGQHYGGLVAAPAFQKIVQEIFNYLNIPPKSKNEGLTAAGEKQRVVAQIR